MLKSEPKAIPVVGLPKLHVTPLALITCNSPCVIVEADNHLEERIRLVFEPFQAVRLTTTDCFEVPAWMVLPPQTIVEIRDSAWVGALSRTLQAVDAKADFMKRARHFLLPLQDEFLEIVALSVHTELVSVLDFTTQGGVERSDEQKT